MAIAMGLVLFVFFVADTADLVRYLQDPSSYPIGAEAAGFRYANRVRFIVMTAAHGSLCMLGLLGAALLRAFDQRQLAIAVLTAAFAVVATNHAVFMFLDFE
jgi:hypothetical protein